MPKIIEQRVIWNEKTNATYKLTAWDNDSVSCEPITAEEAAKWNAEHGGY